MKHNEYTLILPLDDDSHVIFNGINKSFIIIDNVKKESYEYIIHNPNEFILTHPRTLKQLREIGIIVDDDYDPLSELKYQRHQYIHSNVFKATILPTYECNYSCWYCKQNHKHLKKEDIRTDLIIKHLKKYITDNNIDTFILSWFGGEPLTQPLVIEKVSSELQEFCHANNVEYSSGITTNGSLLNTSVITMLKKHKVNNYQITLDGNEVNHNKVKHDNVNKSSFSLILSNIRNLININPEAEVTLRLNYTIHMLHTKNLVEDIAKEIPINLRNNINVDLQKVWQIKEQIISLHDLLMLQKNFVDHGFKLNIDNSFKICYVEKEHYNMYYYNGGVEKCDNRSIDNLRGHIDDNGNIVWKDKPIFDRYDILDEDCICHNCKFYPVCYNGCPVLREERIEEYGKVVCGHKGTYDLLIFRIQDYCWRIIYNNRISNQQDY